MTLAFQATCRFSSNQVRMIVVIAARARLRAAFPFPCSILTQGRTFGLGSDSGSTQVPSVHHVTVVYAVHATMWQECTSTF
jgi:hypothetical protein